MCALGTFPCPTFLVTLSCNQADKPTDCNPDLLEPDLEANHRADSARLRGRLARLRCHLQRHLRPENRRFRISLQLRPYPPLLGRWLPRTQPCLHPKHRQPDIAPDASSDVAPDLLEPDFQANHLAIVFGPHTATNNRADSARLRGRLARLRCHPQRHLRPRLRRCRISLQLRPHPPLLGR